MRRSFLLAVLCAGVVFALPGVAHANTIVVPTNQPTVAAAIAAASSGDTISILNNQTVAGEIDISKNLTITGAPGLPVLSPASDGAPSASMFTVQSGYTVNFNNFTLDATGRKLWYGIVNHGSGTISNVTFKNIAYDQSGPEYRGNAILLDGTGSSSVSNCAFSGIGRTGVDVQNGTATCSSNQYTGKGAGNWLDYAFQIEYGAHVTLSNNTVSNCVGVASDGSGSFAVPVWGDPGTTATLNNNTFTGNSAGVQTEIDPDGNNGSPSVTSSGDKFIGGQYGLVVNAAFANTGDTASTLRITNARITDNSSDAIEIDPGASAANISVNSSAIYRNAGLGVNNQDQGHGVLDATHDYWGSGSGPTVASNPGGSGQAISTFVAYAPFNTVTNTPASSDWSLVLLAVAGLGTAEVIRRKARPAQAS